MSEHDPKIVTGLLGGLLAMGGWIWTRTVGRVDKAHEQIGELQTQLTECSASIEARQSAMSERISELSDGVKAIHSRLDNYFDTPRKP